ncbi:MAG: histidine phosphatase family protein [Cyanobacteria bacterium J06621_11]
MTPPLTRVLLVRHGRSTFNDQGRYQGSSDESVLTEKGRKDAQLVGHYLNQRLAYCPIDLVYSSPLRRVQQTANVIVQSLDPSHRPPLIINPDLKEISLSLWEGLTYAQVKQQFPQQYQRWQEQPAAFELPLASAHSDSHSAYSRSYSANTRTDHSTATTERMQATAAAVKVNVNSDVNSVVATQTYFPVRQLYQSAQQFWQTILSTHAGKTILVVSHSGTIHALISTALNISPEHHHSLQQSNCGISELTFQATSEEHKRSTAISQPVSKPADASSSSCSNLGYRVQLSQLNQTAALGERLPKLKVSKTGLRLLLLSRDGLSLDHCERLAKQMQPLSLNFCIASADLPLISRKLMQHHSNASFIDAQSSDFLQVWQQQWVDSYRTNKTLMTKMLVTGLVLAPAAAIQKLLCQTLGFSSDRHTHRFTSPQIEIAPQHLSVIHYSYRHRPVVQSINTFL